MKTDPRLDRIIPVQPLAQLPARNRTKGQSRREGRPAQIVILVRPLKTSPDVL